MSPPFDASVVRALSELVGRPVSGFEPAGGGSIAAAAFALLGDGERLFFKMYREGPADIAEKEAAGLEALASAGALPVPEGARAGGGDGESPPFLVMQAIATGPARSGTFERFGQALAELHRATEGPRYGFEHDNYIGRTPQPNGWSDDWCAFWRRRRLGHQMALAADAGLADPQLSRLADRLDDRLGDWLPVTGEGGCLLHGDLWSGNYLIDDRGEAWLIDPAVYFGQREAELGMIRLFGGFPSSFHRAYEEAWPLAAGSAERIAIYQLYHVLNHLNLFGRSYRDQAVTLLRRLVG